MREDYLKTNITKYWQAADGDGKVYIYSIAKPALNGRTYVAEYNCTSDFLFPIPLKPLQIAEITVCEDGTWSYEIEREEGWYFVKHKTENELTIWRYESGTWRYRIGGLVDNCHFSRVTISPTRIPDECII